VFLAPGFDSKALLLMSARGRRGQYAQLCGICSSLVSPNPIRENNQQG